jgi:hypothetical protein
MLFCDGRGLAKTCVNKRSRISYYNGISRKSVIRVRLHWEYFWKINSKADLCAFVVILYRNLIYKF